MKRSAVLLLTAVIATASNVAHSDAETIRVAVQKRGTFAWELAVIRAHGLDKQANLSIQALELASPEAGKIALRAGSVDIIVSDWLWVSRERSLGANLTFYPYSSALGAVMVPNTSPIQALVDLKGRKLAVAGGPLDKSWLLLQASLKRDGKFDIPLLLAYSLSFAVVVLVIETALVQPFEVRLSRWRTRAA